MPDAALNAEFDRSTEDVGNVQLLEHVNLTVPDQGLAALFYVTALGFTRDPYIDFGTRNMWVNVGDQQFHLPTNTPQKLRGHIGVVVPSLEGVLKRLKFAGAELSDSQFGCEKRDDHLQLTCPFGNLITAWEPCATDPLLGGMDLGIPYLQLDVKPNTSAGIARFYTQVLDCPARAEGGVATVAMGHNQQLRFVETEQPLAPYDGHHIAIYVANFSGPHRALEERGLISEESDAHQYRFQRLIDPDSGELLHELEHEVRSLKHAMYRRPLVNRNAATNFYTYKRGNEQFSPTST